jgi:hypothetical protein
MSITFVSLDFLKKEKSNPYWFFKILNSTRFGKHSVNKSFRNDEGKTMVVRCNCGRKAYHPVNNGKVSWDVKIQPKHLLFYIKLESKKAAIIFED